MDIGPGAAAAQCRRLRARSEAPVRDGRTAAPRPPFLRGPGGTPPESRAVPAVGA